MGDHEIKFKLKGVVSMEKKGFANKLVKWVPVVAAFCVIIYFFGRQIPEMLGIIDQRPAPGQVPFNQEQIVQINSITIKINEIGSGNDLRTGSFDSSIIEDIYALAHHLKDQILLNYLEEARVSNNYAQPLVRFNDIVLTLKRMESKLISPNQTLEIANILATNILEKLSTQDIQNLIAQSSDTDSQNQNTLLVPTVNAGITMTSMRINFGSDSTSIRESDKPTLLQVVDLLNLYPGSFIGVSAHTDWIGSDEYNYYLGEQRLNSVMQYLIDQGVDSYRFYNPISYGETKPIASNETEEGRFRNNRIEFLLYTYGSSPEIPEGTKIENVIFNESGNIIVNGNGTFAYSKELLTNPVRFLIKIPGLILPNPVTIERERGNFIGIKATFNREEFSTEVYINLKEPVEPPIMQSGRQLTIGGTSNI